METLPGELRWGHLPRHRQSRPWQKLDFDWISSDFPGECNAVSPSSLTFCVLCFSQVSAADLSSSKDEEENAMHNTVVLFSSSDKFTLQQVRAGLRLPGGAPWPVPPDSHAQEPSDRVQSRMGPQGTLRKTRDEHITPSQRSAYFQHARVFSLPGHVRGLRQLRPGSGGQAAGLFAVRSVLPPVLRQR